MRWTYTLIAVFVISVAGVACSSEPSPSNSNTDPASAMRQAISELETEDDTTYGEGWRGAHDYVVKAESPAEIREIVENFDNPLPTYCVQSVEMSEGYHYTIGDLLFYLIQRRLWDRNTYVLSKLTFMRSKEAMTQWAASHGYDFKKMKQSYDEQETYPD